MAEIHDIKEYTRCIYSKIEPNIRHLLMTEASRKAVDEYIEIMESFMDNYEEDQVIHTLMDSSVGVQPIAHIFSRTRKLIKKYPQANRNQSETKLALILPSIPMVSMIETMMRAFPQLQTRIFTPGQQEEAIAWLRE